MDLTFKETDMASSHRTSLKAEKQPHSVLILDHDETIAISEKKSNGDYIIQEDGSINATIMDKAQLQRIVDLAILFHVPIHVVTARADIPGDRKVVEGIIDSVGGFHSGLGGFKKEQIHFASTKDKGIWKPIFTKVEIIDHIHQTLYPGLSRTAFLFVDDMMKYLEGVKKSGYLTFRANPETKDHFELIEEFILNRGIFYTYQPMLFKKLIASIPSQKDELPHGVSQEIIEDGIRVLKNS